MQNSKKTRFRRIFIAKEILMSALALLSIGLLVLEQFELLSLTWLIVIEWFEISVGVLFLIEFFVELHYAKDRKMYWKYHWYFLFASIPLPFQSVDWLRGIRALRILRLSRAFAHLDYERNNWKHR